MTIAELAGKIKEKVVLNYIPDEKLPSERLLAEDFSSTQNRVHRALALLVREGVLYTKIGAGTFFSGKNMKNGTAIPIQNNQYSVAGDPIAAGKLELRVRVILDNDLSEKSLWENMFQNFSRKYPYIRVVPIFVESGAVPVPCDVIINNIHGAFPVLHEFAEMNRDDLRIAGFSFDELADGCEPLMTLGGGVFMLPLMRIRSTLLVNTSLLRGTGISPEELNAPDNLFALASALEQKTGIPAMNYQHYHWHGCNYGLVLKEDGNGNCILDWSLLEKLIRDISGYVNAENYNTSDPILRFTSGRMILLNLYLPKQISCMSDDNIFRADPIRKNVGFLPETITTAMIPKNTAHFFEAELFASYLSSRPAQELLFQTFPGWLPVRRDVLEENGLASETKIDPRPFYSLFSRRIFHEYGPRINFETAKCCLGIQSVEKTMSVLKTALHRQS